MARKCKCKKCGKQLTTDEAFCVQVETKSGNTKNTYYCDEEEYREVEMDKRLWRQIQLGIDYIMGYKVISNSKNKMIKELTDNGYTRKEVYECIVEMKETIADALRYRQDIDEEYGKLCYVFAIIKNNINKITKNNQRVKVTENHDIDMNTKQSEEPIRSNRRKSLAEMLGGNKKDD